MKFNFLGFLSLNSVQISPLARDFRTLTYNIPFYSGSMLLNLHSLPNEATTFGGGHHIFLRLLRLYGRLNLISLCKKEVTDRIGIQKLVYIYRVNM